MTIFVRATVSLALLSLSAIASADAVIDQLRAAAATAKPQAFERTSRIEDLAGKTPVTTVRVDRFDPANGGQWRLLSVDGRTPTDAEIAAHRKQVSAMPPPGFHNLARILAGTPQASPTANGRTLYRWASLPAGAVKTPGPDISQRLSAEITVDKSGREPSVREVRIYAAEPFSIMSVAKMNRFDVISHYKPGTAGQPVLTAQTSDTDVSAPFGRGGKSRSQISFRPL